MRLSEGPAEVACTNLYLNDEQWRLLVALPAQFLCKKRHIIERDRVLVAIDEYADGTLIAEIDDRDSPSDYVPGWLDVVRDVSNGEACLYLQPVRAPQC